MNRYEEILAYLQEQVDNGSMSLEEAEVLNEAAFEKYNNIEESEEGPELTQESEEDEEDDSVTLEEAMDVIEDILMEKMSIDALKKDATVVQNKKLIKAAKKENKGIRKEIQASSDTSGWDNNSSNSDQRERASRHRIDLYDREYNNNKAIKDMEEYNKQNSGPKVALHNMAVNAKKAGNAVKNGPAALKQKLSNMGKKNVAVESEEINIEESVNALRLRVFEAADAGQISEEEKVTMLDYLNLENYS